MPPIDEFNLAMAPHYAARLNQGAIKPASHCVPSLMLWLSEPDVQFFLRPSLYTQTVAALTGERPEGRGNVMTSDYYASAVQFVRTLGSALAAGDLAPADMIDVQGFMWGVFNYDKIWFGGKIIRAHYGHAARILATERFCRWLRQAPRDSGSFLKSRRAKKEDRELRLKTLNTLTEGAEQKAMNAFFELACSPGSLLLTKSVFFSQAIEKSVLRISAVGITRDGYQFDLEVGHQIPVEWREEVDQDLMLSGPQFPKLNGTLTALPILEALDALSSPVSVVVAVPDDPEAQFEALAPTPAKTPVLQPKYTIDDFVARN